MTDDHQKDASAALTAELGSLLSGMLHAESRESAAAAQELPSSKELTMAREAIQRSRPSDFDILWRYPQEKITRGILMSEGIRPFSPEEDLYLGYAFFEGHFAYVFTTFEGGACNVDKARWALKALLRHFKDGVPIAVEHTEDSFWLPTKVLCTQETLVEFFQGLRALKHGRPERYLKSMLELSTLAKAD